VEKEGRGAPSTEQKLPAPNGGDHGEAGCPPASHRHHAEQISTSSHASHTGEGKESEVKFVRVAETKHYGLTVTLILHSFLPFWR